MTHLPFVRRLGLMWSAMRDPRTPLPAKLLVVLALTYAASPLDLIPDILPVVGWTDDIGILVAALLAFLRLAARAMEAMDKEERGRGVIDVEATERTHGRR